MDSGPIIAQGAVAVHADDSEATLAARVLEVEHQIYPLALKLLAEGRVRVENGRCLIDGVPVPDAATVGSIGLNFPHNSNVNIPPRPRC